MSLNAGTIEYTVSVETQQSIDAARQFDRQMDQVQDSARRTDRELGRLDSGFSKLATAIKGVIAVSALRSMAGMVQQYQAMAERVEMATRSTEEFETVQKRLQTTADGTYRSLAEAQELYIRTADSIRDMGYTLEETIDIQDSMSYAFVTNATSADRAQAAINQFTKSINTGKVSADQWETISSAIPTVMNDIAAASGKSASEVRALGAAGKLTARELTEGLRKSLDETRASADEMATDLIDASVRAKNAITTVLVGLENQTGAIQAVTDGIIAASEAMLEFGQDAEKMEAFLKLATVAGASLAAVMVGRVVMAMGAYTYGQVAALQATIAKTGADKAAMQALVRKTSIEKDSARATMLAAKVDFDAAKGSGAHATALNNLTAAKSRYMAATTAAAAAQSAANRVMTLGTIAANGLRTAMAFLGGPVGVALLAAAALYTLSASAKEVAIDMTSLKSPLDEVIARLREMDEIARDAELRNMVKGIDQLKSAYRDLGAEVAYAARDMGRALGDVTDANSDTAAAMEAVKQAGINVLKGVPQEFDDLHESIKANVNITDEYKGQLLDLVARLSESNREGKDAVAQYYNVANAAAGMGQEVNAAAGEIDNLNESLRTGSSAAAEYAQKMSRALEDKKDNSAVGRLSRDIRDNAEAWSTATKAEIDAAYAAAFASDAYDAQQKKLKKTTTARKGLTEAQREAKKAEDDAKRGAESNTKAIDDLRESISQTALSAGELAARQAELRLNQYATPEQIELIRELGAELYDINELNRQKDAFGTDVGGKIRGDVPVLQGGGFDDGTARYEAEAQAERQRYAEQLERLVEAEELKLEVVGGYDAMREQLYQEHSDRMAEIDRVRTDMQLTQWAQGFKTMASDIQEFASVFASESKAMFAVSKAAAIAGTVIETITSAQRAFSAMAGIPYVGPALGIAAAAAAVGAGMARVANIRSQTMGGGRRYGGAVNDNKYYRVNEDGRPEIFKGADGSQYMMPNQRGEVISHDDAIGGQQRAGNTVNVTQNITMRSDNGNYTAKQVMLESSRRQSIAEARLG